MGDGGLRKAGGLTYFSFGSLENQPGLVQAVFTRHGGVSRAPFATLNAGRLAFFLGGWTADYPDALTFLEPLWHGASPYNRSRWRDPGYLSHGIETVPDAGSVHRHGKCGCMACDGPYLRQ